MSTLRWLRFTTLLCTSLVAGLTLCHVLQGPGSRGLDGPTWLAVQHRFYGGFAVLGGLSEIVGLLAAFTVAVLARDDPGTRRTHALVAGCLAGTLLAFVVGNLPVNRVVAKTTGSALPANWPQLRDQWERAHATSAAIALIALLVLLAHTASRSEPHP